MMKFLAQEAADMVSISDRLHAALTTVDPARPIGNLHASALTRGEFCPREVALCKKLGRLPYPQKIDAAMQITFQEGRDKQARLNNHWLRKDMVGDWRCDRCGMVTQWARNVQSCFKCHGTSMTYQEVVFHHPSGVQGSLDAIVYVERPLLRLVEFKIMGTDEWVGLKAPLAEHRARSKLYLELIRESNHPCKTQIDTGRMHVVYCLRGYGKKDIEKGRISPFKEFIVHAGAAEVMPYFKMAWAVTQARQSEWAQLPEGVCNTLFDKRCHLCSVSKDCFSGLYAATIAWK